MGRLTSRSSRFIGVPLTRAATASVHARLGVTVEGARVVIDAIKRAAPQIDKGKDITEKREALRQAIANTKNFEGINGKFSLDENGDTTTENMSGFKVVKADNPIGCKFEFETVLE